jgi:tetratricopeptide (TPR) repeat protein
MKQESPDPFSSALITLGIAIVCGAVNPLLGASSLAGVAVTGVLGSATWEIVAQLRDRFAGKNRIRRTPNHDLNRALGKAILEAYRDFKHEHGDTLQGEFRKSHIHLPDYAILGTYVIQEFEKSFGADSAILADNPTLVKILEGTPESIPELSATLRKNLAATVLPNVPDHLSKWIIDNLSTRIEARFWDEVKRDSSAWRAYSAEVFKEINQSLKEIKNSQIRLESGQAKTIEEIRSLVQRKAPRVNDDGTVTESEEGMSTIPEFVVDKIKIREKEIDEQLKLIRDGLSRILDGVDSILRGQEAHIRLTHRLVLLVSQNRMVSILCVGITLVVATLGFIPRGKEVEIPDNSSKLWERILRSQSEKTLIRDLAEAEIEKDWTKREERRKAAKTAHEEFNGDLPHLVAFLSSVFGEDADGKAIMDEAERIELEQGKGESLKYFEKANQEYLERIGRREGAIQRATSADLERFLAEARFSELNGKYDLAESQYDKLVEAAPSYDSARYQLVRFLNDFKAPRQDKEKDRLLALEKADFHANALLAHDQRDVGRLRKFSICKERLASSQEALGEKQAARTNIIECIELIRRWKDLDPADPEAAYMLGVVKMRLADWRGLVPGTSLKGAYEEILDLSEEAIRLDPSYVGGYELKGFASMRLGLASGADGDDEFALERYEDSVNAFGQARNLDPDDDLHLIHCSQAYLFSAEFWAGKGHAKNAKESWEKSVGISGPLIEKSPFDRMLKILEIWQFQIEALIVELELGQYEAIEPLSRAVNLIESLAKSDPENVSFKNVLRLVLFRIGSLETYGGDIERGYELLKRSHGLAVEIFGLPGVPIESQEALVSCKLALGAAAVRFEDDEERVEEGRRLLKEALNIFSVVEAGGRSDLIWRSLAGEAHFQLGGQELTQGDLADAKEHFSESLKLRREVLKVSPYSISIREDLALTISGLYNVEEKIGNKEVLKPLEDEFQAVQDDLVRLRKGMSSAEEDSNDRKRVTRELLEIMNSRNSDLPVSR